MSHSDFSDYNSTTLNMQIIILDAQNVTCVKNNTLQDTLKLVKQLAASGASLIAVHARYRGTPTHRRDGPAHLDQVGGWREREDRMVSSKKG